MDRPHRAWRPVCPRRRVDPMGHHRHHVPAGADRHVVQPARPRRPPRPTPHMAHRPAGALMVRTRPHRRVQRRHRVRPQGEAIGRRMAHRRDRDRPHGALETPARRGTRRHDEPQHRRSTPLERDARRPRHGDEPARTPGRRAHHRRRHAHQHIEPQLHHASTEGRIPLTAHALARQLHGLLAATLVRVPGR